MVELLTAVAVILLYLFICINIVDYFSEQLLILNSHAPH